MIFIHNVYNKRFLNETNIKVTNGNAMKYIEIERSEGSLVNMLVFLPQYFDSVDPLLTKIRLNKHKTTAENNKQP